MLPHKRKMVILSLVLLLTASTNASLLGAQENGQTWLNQSANFLLQGLPGTYLSKLAIEKWRTKQIIFEKWQNDPEILYLPSSELFVANPEIKRDADVLMEPFMLKVPPIKALYNEAMRVANGITMNKIAKGQIEGQKKVEIPEGPNIIITEEFSPPISLFDLSDIYGSPAFRNRWLKLVLLAFKKAGGQLSEKSNELLTALEKVDEEMDTIFREELYKLTRNSKNYPTTAELLDWAKGFDREFIASLAKKFEGEILKNKDDITDRVERLVNHATTSNS